MSNGPSEFERSRRDRLSTAGEPAWGFWLPAIRMDDPQVTAPLRFRLGELFLTVTVAAVLLAMFRALGIVGAAVAFLVAVAFTNLIYPRFNRDSPARQDAMFDFVWGLLMPVVCLVFDPFVFKFEQRLETGSPIDFLVEPWGTPQLYAWSIPAYALLGWQLLCLGIWMVAGRLPADVSAIWTGMLWSGFALACVLGVVLFLPALLGITFMGVGLLGFTPLFTARAFKRRAMVAGAIATRESASRRAGWLAFLGYWLAMPVPIFALVIGWFLLSAWS
jgi:hypothetical protein